jgi:glutamyl-tRNA synthetase
MSRLSYSHEKEKDQELKMAVLKYSLQNAVLHEGKASIGAVLGKVMAKKPELRDNISGVKNEVENAVRSVNFISFEEQKRRLEKLVPPAKKNVEKNKKQGLPELDGAEKGRVVTRFAPCPSGPLNILQVLRAVMLSYLYAKKYKGKFVLRFEDTDPSPGKIEKGYYDMIRQDMRFLGVKWDDEIIASKNIERFYEFAEELIEGDYVYVDFTPAEEFRKLKIKKKDPQFRNASKEENLKAWKDMLAGQYKEGQAVLRFKTNMQDKNPAFRDPAIFRIAKGIHPLVGDKYCVWPLYNFANVIEDHEAGVTHIFRGKEHEHNSYIQNKIYMALGWEPPSVLNFGMIYLPGKKEHTRDIKEKIKKGKYSGWDDPRLHTITSLRRKGFQGKAFHEVAVTVGLSKSDIKFSMESLETANRRIIDPKANRYMAVLDPVKIAVKGYPHSTNFVTEPLHPDFPRRGSKRLPVDVKNIFVSKDDWKKSKGKTIRLKGFTNIKLAGKTGNYAGDDITKTMQKIQWVSKPHLQIELRVPEGDNLTKLNGVGEPAMAKLRPGDIIQLERVGFGVVSSVQKDKVSISWTHR